MYRKTNYMLFGNNRNMVDCSIYINNIEIERVYVTKFLGLHIDCKLDWKVHIQNVKTCQKLCDIDQSTT